MKILLVYAIVTYVNVENGNTHDSCPRPIKAFKDEEKAREFMKKFKDSLWSQYIQLYNKDYVITYLKEIDYEE